MKKINRNDRIGFSPAHRWGWPGGRGARFPCTWLGWLFVFGFSLMALTVEGSTAPAKTEALCLAADSSRVFVDGRLDDWRGIAGHRLAHQPDAGLVVRCTYDAKNLALSFNVRDDKVVRVPKGATAGQDRVVVELDAGRRKLSLVVLPGNRMAEPKVLGAGRSIQVADSLQPQGFSVEVLIPRRAISGWHTSVPTLRARLAFHDVDRAVPGRADEVIAIDGALHFEAHWKTFWAFLRTAKLARRDLYLDQVVDVDAGAGRERLVAGQTVVGVLSDRFTYFGLPVRHRSDIVDLRAVDFDGSGRSAIVAHMRQSQGSHRRELVGVWFVESGGQFRQALLFEVKRQAPGRTVENTWVLEPGKKGRGHVIRVVVGEVRGWNKRSIAAIDTEGARPVLTPWGAQETTYSFDGGELLINEKER